MGFYGNVQGKYWVLVGRISKENCYTLCAVKQGAIKLLKTELIIQTIGEPNIQALSESEQRIFFDTLFANIMQLYKQSKEV